MLSVVVILSLLPLPYDQAGKFCYGPAHGALQAVDGAVEFVGLMLKESGDIYLVATGTAFGAVGPITHALMVGMLSSYQIDEVFSLTSQGLYPVLTKNSQGDIRENSPFDRRFVATICNQVGQGLSYQLLNELRR